MKFSAVRNRFKPLTEEAVRTLGRGEDSVYLDEVGLDVVARELARKYARDQVPAGQEIHL